MLTIAYFIWSNYPRMAVLLVMSILSNDLKHKEVSRMGNGNRTGVQHDEVAGSMEMVGKGYNNQWWPAHHEHKTKGTGEEICSARWDCSSNYKFYGTTTLVSSRTPVRISGSCAEPIYHDSKTQISCAG